MTHPAQRPASDPVADGAEPAPIAALNDLKRRIRRALWFSRDAHGGVPFGDAKRYWQMGYDEAKRAALREVNQR